MLDVSYAAAWQLGRLLCLQDKVLAHDLYQWKRGNELVAIAEMEKRLLEYSFPKLKEEMDKEDSDHFEQLNHETIKLLIKIFK